MRRIERALPTWYRDLIRAALPHGPAAQDQVRQLAEIPDKIRGYEDIKLDSVTEAKAEAEALFSQLEAGTGRAA